MGIREEEVTGERKGEGGEAERRSKRGGEGERERRVRSRECGGDRGIDNYSISLTNIHDVINLWAV